MKKQAGFTLLELLIVILIIGVLAVIALPQYQRTVDKSHATQMFVIGKAVKDAQELYYLTHGHYSTSWDELDLEIDDSKKSSVVFQECSSSIPSSAYVYHPKLVRTFIVVGYAHQCSAPWWKNTRKCYADKNNRRSLNVCSSLTGRPESECAESGQYCIYDF